MNEQCLDVRERLAEPGARSAPDLAAHLRGCADCRGAARALSLAQATAAEPDEAALRKLERGVLARSRSPQRPSPRRLWLPAAGFASAAALAAVLAIWPTAGSGPAAGVAGPSAPVSSELALAEGWELLEADLDLPEDDSFESEDLDWEI